MKTPLPPQVVSLDSLGLKCFASLFNDTFDFSRASLFFLLLVECAREHLSIEALCNMRRLSPDRLQYYMGMVSMEEMIAFVSLTMEQSLELLKKHGKKLTRWGFLVAIDLTDLEYYGQADEYVHNSVKRKGTRYQRATVYRYATLSIIGWRFKLTLAILPVRKEEKLEDVVDQLLTRVEKLVRIRCVILDKGFYNTAVLNMIEEHRLHYLLPVVKREDVDLLYWQCTVTDKWRWKYVMNKTDKTRCKEVTIYFHELYASEYIGFITNRGMKSDTGKRLIRLYDQRWNIENGYKEAEDFLVRTSSKNHAYRLFLYMISHLLVNLQNIVRETRYRVRYYEMHKIIELVLQGKKGEQQITKRLIAVL